LVKFEQQSVKNQLFIYQIGIGLDRQIAGIPSQGGRTGQSQRFGVAASLL
jgi:hypothetical protein